uniref:Uncharacterized protein n=1 Tax=Tanacetum cinerariifolium TaxID=118510 RepID=A0A699HV04_TANCI|nr:hypothetical protein [Tanacetum cinerariifolium]
MNQNLYNSSGLDQSPPYLVVHQPPQETNTKMLQARESLMEAIQAFLKKYDQIPFKEKCIALLRAEEKFIKVKQALEEEQNQPEIIQELLLQLIHDLQLLNEIQPKQAEEKGINKQVQKKQEKKSIAELLAEEQAARINSLFQDHDPSQFFISLEDDNDDNNYDKISMNTNIFETPSSDAITTSSQIEEPEDSLMMEDEDINTIPEKESDEENESSVENLFHILSESEVTFDNENLFLILMVMRPLVNILVITSQFLRRTILREKNSDLPFEFDKESISSDMNPIYDEVLEDIDGTNYLIDYIINSSKIDPLLEEFAGELALINPIPWGIDEINFDHEENIRLIEKLLYDNSSPHPPKELNFKISIESFSPSHIPVEDSDSLMEEIDTFHASDDSIPPGIYSDGNDSKEVLEDIDDTNYLIDSIINSSKIDPLLEEFVGELALINPIPWGIDEINFDHKENIRLIEKLLYDNSSPRPPKELNFEISIESSSPSPIPVEDSDSLMEEIDTFHASDDSIPSGIYSDSNDSEEVNFFLEYEVDPGELNRVVVEDILENLEFVCLMFYPPIPPFLWIQTSLLQIISADPIL